MSVLRLYSLLDSIT